MEFLYFPKLNDKLVRSFIKFNNPEVVEESKSAGRGTFLLSGHLSNWELAAFAYPINYDEKLNLVAKIQASKSLNEKINEYRTLSGNSIIEIGFSLKDIFKRIIGNQIVCFLVDQSAHPDYSTYINFFGKKVPAFSGPAKIALKLHPALIIAYVIREENFSYNIYFEKIEYDDVQESDNDGVNKLTQRIQSKFEEIIRKYPGQWLWFHKRFKHSKS